MSHEPHQPHEPLLYAEDVFAIQGAIFEVNRQRLGLRVNFGSAPKARIERLVL